MTKVIRDPEFASRLERACEDHPHCPTKEYRGKQKWLREELVRKFGEDFQTTAEGVRKWFSGEARPRPRMMKAIASVLNVDEGWLALGIIPELTPREKKKRGHTAEGGALILAGAIQITGGHTTFPSTGDVNSPDIVAIIDGEAIEIDAPLSRQISETSHLFTIKRGHERRTVVGVIPTNFGARFIALSTHVITKNGTNRGDYIELEVTEKSKLFFVLGQRLREITALDMLVD